MQVTICKVWCRVSPPDRHLDMSGREVTGRQMLPALVFDLFAFSWKILVPLDRQYSYETRHRILIKVNHGIETGTGILIFLGYY